MECVEVVKALSQKEKNTILGVLQRDERLRNEQDQKVKTLKSEIQLLRSNAVLRSGDDHTKTCLRCRRDFGFLFNRGALCPVCKYKVCKECQEMLFNGSWLCSLCYRQRQLKWLTGDWASFEKNPLRKWASGSDIVRASMSLSAATIDIDKEPESEPQVSNNKQRSRKPAHNGVTSPTRQEAKTRVEYPKENDQMRLSQLFDVLRSKKPEERPTETQVMRVSTRRYSESDSDSSSSSELVLDSCSHRSSPNAPSVTESEFDARLSPPVSLSPSHSLVESPRSTDSGRVPGQGSGVQGQRPIPAPRSPKPAVRSKTKEQQGGVRPKTRTQDTKAATEKSKLRLRDEAKVSMSRSVDINLGADLKNEAEYKRRAVSSNELNLDAHVNRTKESLDMKSRSHNVLSSADPQKDQKRSSDSDLMKDSRQKNGQTRDGVLHRPASSEIEGAARVKVEKIKRKQKRGDFQDDARSEGKKEPRQTRNVEAKSDKGRREDKHEDVKHESVEIHNDSMPEADRVTAEVSQSSDRVNVHDNVSEHSDKISVSSRTSADIVPSTHSKEEDFQFVIPVPRTGSPYSFSMDSLPSSHPSPTMRQKVHDLGLIESSDNESISRLSHPDASEHSGTESVVSKNSEEDFDVEALSKVRFQRVSKKIGQMGIMSKIKSPKRNVTGDGRLAAETQSYRGVFEGGEEGGEMTVVSDIPNTYTGDMTVTNLEEDVDEFFLVSKASDSNSENEDALKEEPAVKRRHTLKLSAPSNDSENYKSIEEEMVVQKGHTQKLSETANGSDTDDAFEEETMVVKKVHTQQLNVAADSFMKKLEQMDPDVRKESIQSAQSVDVSWIDEYVVNTDQAYTQEEIDEAREDWLKQQGQIGLVMEMASKRSKPSEADSIEMMIDEMTGPELQLTTSLQKPRAESELTTDVNLTPVTPMSAYSPFDYEIQTNIRERYRFSYMSDDQDLDSGDDLLDDQAFEGSKTSAGSADVMVKTTKGLNEDVDDKEGVKKEENNNNTETVVRLKPALKAMGSLDLLVDQQGELIENSMEDVQLDAEFQEVLKIAAAETSTAISELINKTDSVTVSHMPDVRKETEVESVQEESDDDQSDRKFNFQNLVSRFSPKSESKKYAENKFEYKHQVNLAEEIKANTEAEAKFNLEKQKILDKAKQNIVKEDIQANTKYYVEHEKQHKEGVENRDDSKSSTDYISQEWKSKDLVDLKDKTSIGPDRSSKAKLTGTNSMELLLQQQHGFLKEDELSRSVDLSDELQFAERENIDIVVSDVEIEDKIVKNTSKRKLQAANSLDKLIESQGSYLNEEDIDTTIDLSPELVSAMEQQFRKDVKLEESTASTSNKDLQYASVKSVHISSDINASQSDEVAEDKIVKHSTTRKLQAANSLDRLIETQGSNIMEEEMETTVDISPELVSAMEQQFRKEVKLDNRTAKLNKIQHVKGKDMDNSVGETDTELPAEITEEMIVQVASKRKLEAASSLDKLIEDQGSSILDEELKATVDISPELVAALEQQFRTEVNLENSSANSDSESDCLPEDEFDHNETNKVSLYRFDHEEPEDFNAVFGTQSTVSNNQVFPDDVDFTPIGFAERTLQYDSNDSDALSVITEEDELAESTDEESKPVDKNCEVSNIGIYFKEKMKENLGDSFPLDITAPTQEKKKVETNNVRGKLYVKVQDTRKVSAASGGAARLIGNKAASNTRFRKTQDNWVAVEVHEADILDVEDDGNEENDVEEEEVLGSNSTKSTKIEAETVSKTECAVEVNAGVILNEESQTGGDQVVKVRDDAEDHEDTGHIQAHSISIVITDTDAECTASFEQGLPIKSENNICCDENKDDNVDKPDTTVSKFSTVKDEQQMGTSISSSGKIKNFEYDDGKPERDEEVQDDGNQSDEIKDDMASQSRISINDSNALCQSIGELGAFNIDPNTVDESKVKDKMFGVHKTVMECKSIGDLESPSEDADPMLYKPEDICQSIREDEMISFHTAVMQCNSIQDLDLPTEEEDPMLRRSQDYCRSIREEDAYIVSNEDDKQVHSLGSSVKSDTILSDEHIQGMLGHQITVVEGQITVERRPKDTLGLDEMLGTRDSLRQCNSIGDEVVPADPALLGASVNNTCSSLAEGDTHFFYNVDPEDEQCHSIDEVADFRHVKPKFVSNKKVEKLLAKAAFETISESPSDTDKVNKGKNKGSKEKKKGSKGKEEQNTKSDMSDTTTVRHEPLKRLHDNTNAEKLALEIMSLGPLVKTKTGSTDSDESLPNPYQPSNTVDPPQASETSSVKPEVSPVTNESPISASSPFPVMARMAEEKLAGVQETPQPVSEGSTISQDDSGHVSGGSRGTTPEHKRQDSNFSTSSIPSTLSTVTDEDYNDWEEDGYYDQYYDQSEYSSDEFDEVSLQNMQRSTEDEDIDKVITNLTLQKAGGSRGNLLSVIADSRESICSYYSDAGDVSYNTVPITGEVLFGVNYNYKTSMLEVAVKSCKDIAVADVKKHKSDPYVKTYLLPDKTRSGKRKTKVKKHSTSPTFEETLRYSISKSELENRTLWLTVWHNDRFGRNIFLGEVTINFDYYKFDDPSPRWYPLQERVESQPASMMVYKGDLSVSIKFVSADMVTTSGNKGKGKKDSGKGQLHVKVKEARNLTAVRSNGFSDPFCKGYLLPERHKSSKQKTAVMKKDCNPAWNHTFIFEDVTLLELRERCLELTIWDYEKLSSNDFLGGVRLNLGTGLSQAKQVDWMDARGEEMSIWQAMLDRPNIWIDGALILRPNMEKRKY